MAEVAEKLNGKSGSAYTTVLTMMRIMRDKGYLACSKEGRAHIYTPKVNREVAAGNAVRQLLTKFFSGSPGELVLRFLKNEDLSESELNEIKQQIRDSAKSGSRK